jgi:hypothetical protein
MSPLASWWFYAPFLLFIPAAILATYQTEKNKDTTFLGLVIMGILIWSLVNIARFLIYIIPFSGPVISSRYFSVAAVFVGLILYRLRGRYPLVYGLTEVAVAILAIFVSIGTDTPYPLNKIVGILGGIYIFVRGMDNIDRGLPNSWRDWWDRWFPKKQSGQHMQAAEQNVEAQPAEAKPEGSPPA